MIDSTITDVPEFLKPHFDFEVPEEENPYQ